MGEITLTELYLSCFKKTSSSASKNNLQHALLKLQNTCKSNLVIPAGFRAYLLSSHLPTTQ